ncbi:MAG TPA: phenylalanine--tRNA ligase subunit alpha [bacterium]
MAQHSDLDQIGREADAAAASAQTPEALEQVRRHYLGRRGILAGLTADLPRIPASDRPQFGQRLNALRAHLDDALRAREAALRLRVTPEHLEAETIDVTMPGRRRRLGRRHVLSRTLQEVQDIFYGMGFELVEGPEVESEEFNFERLNLPRDHPARDAQDSFYITDDLLLRTQSTAVDARVMIGRTPPMRILTTGRCYRRDASDPTHMPIFHQVDGFMVGERITMADLKGVLATFARQFFGPETATKFVPGYFPFTEPSAETLVSFRGGWMELGGCGMFHPRVLEIAGIDPQRYSAFAFGWGVERPAMVRYGIPDLRLFWENDLRFLEQF